MTEDFITKYVNFKKGITDAPVEYHEPTALYLISTMVGRRWYILTTPDIHYFTKKDKGTGGKYLNFFFLLLGKSRIARKTSGVIKDVTDILNEICPEITLPDSSTPQYLVSTLAIMGNGSETPATWVDDECSLFFELLYDYRGYMTGIDAILSRAYDCRTYSGGTIKRQKEIIKNPYFTAFLATVNQTVNSFKDKGLRQGLLNRFVYVPGKSKNRRPIQTRLLTKEEEKTSEEILDYLRALKNFSENIAVKMDNEARDLVNNYTKKNEDYIEKHDLDISESYIASLPDIMLKSAALYRLSRLTTEEINHYKRPLLVIEYQDMERGQIFAEKCREWFLEMLKLRAKYSKTPAEERRIIYRNKAIAIIGEPKYHSQDRWVTITRIRDHLAIKIDTLLQIMYYLESAGMVEKASPEVLEAWKGKGRKPTRAWRLKRGN